MLREQACLATSSIAKPGRTVVKDLYNLILQCKKETLLRLCRNLAAHAMLRINKEISEAGPPPGGLSIKLRGD